MQQSKISSSIQRQSAFLLFDGFSNHCLANAVEPLRAANTISGTPFYSWRFISVDGEDVESSSGLTVSTHGKLSDESGDLLVVMPSYGFRNYCGFDHQRELRAASKRFTTLAGFDTGSWLLAAAGLLTGFRATIHRDEFAGFSEAFPDVETTNMRFVIDRNRITCTGAAAAFDLILNLIIQDHGEALGLEVSKIFMMRTREMNPLWRHSCGDHLINRAIVIMDENLENTISIQKLAAALGCSQKTLEKRVNAELGITPNALYRRLRLALARKHLQETTLKIAEISLRSGYESPSAMTRAFKAEFGQSPQALRKSYLISAD